MESCWENKFFVKIILTFQPRWRKNYIKIPETLLLRGSGLMEQGTGVEPASQAWEARVLPMY